MLEQSIIESLAARVLWAEETRTPIDLFSAAYPDMSLADGYRVQLAYVALRRQRGERIIGKKVGATNRAIMQQLGLTSPVFGFNFAAPAFSASEPIAANSMIHPKVEPELAFVLNRRLEGPGVTLADVLRATEGVVPAFEVADSRFTTWRMPPSDLVADNSHAVGMTLGAKLTSVRDLDLRCTGAVLEQNGEIVGTAATAAALGNPALAVVWLANALAEHGYAIEEGDIILTGSLTGALDARRGDVFTVTLGGLGSVTARFA